MQVKGEDKLELIENIRLLHCLNEQGHSKVNGILKDLVQNPEYIEVSYEQLTEELKEEKKQHKEKLEIDRKQREDERKQLEEQYANDWLIVRNQHLPFDKKNVIEAIFNLTNSSFVGRLNVFNLGVIEGKRAERARRKKVKV